MLNYYKHRGDLPLLFWGHYSSCNLLLLNFNSDKKFLKLITELDYVCIACCRFHSLFFHCMFLMHQCTCHLTYQFLL